MTCPCIINLKLLQLCFAVSVISFQCCHSVGQSTWNSPCVVWMFVKALVFWEVFGMGKVSEQVFPSWPAAPWNWLCSPEHPCLEIPLAHCTWCLGAPCWGGKPRDCGLTYPWNILDIKAVITFLRAWWVIKLVSKLQVSSASHFHTSYKTLAVKLCGWVHEILES